MKEKILVVDDSESLQNLVKLSLKDDYEVESVFDVLNIEDFYKEIEKTNPGLIMIGVGLPSSNGIDICKSIKASEVLRNIPIIIMTSDKDKKLIQKSFAALADDFILKPLNRVLLPFQIKFHLEKIHYFQSLKAKNKILNKVQQISKIYFWELPESGFALEKLLDFSKNAQKQIKFKDEKSCEKFVDARERELKRFEFGKTIHFQYSNLTEENYFHETVFSSGKKVFGIVQDVTELKKASEKLEYVENHDQLTGLANERYLKKLLKYALKISEREDNRIAVLTLILENEKEVLSATDQNFLNEILKESIESITPAIRDYDQISFRSDHMSRFHTNQVVMFFTKIGEIKNCAKVAKRIYSKLNKKVSYGKINVKLNYKIGIAMSGQDGANAEELINNSQTAIYQNQKNSNSDLYFYFYNEEDSAKSLENFKLETEINRALKNNEFELYFQPQRKTEDGHKVFGAEALLRWNHPEKGVLTPGPFIEFAESSGQIIEIGKWCICKSFNISKKWEDLGRKIKISVNLSIKQITRDLSLLKFIKDVLEQTKASPSLLCFEITESCLFEDYELVFKFLTELKKMGFSIALDDFGTGYSSLSYLRKLPIDNVKLDRSFLENIKEDQKHQSFVKCVGQLARSYELGFLIEGVETSEMAKFCRDLGVLEVQGFKMPMPESEFISLLQV